MNIVSRPRPVFTGCVDNYGDPIYIGDIVEFIASRDDLSKPVTLKSIIGIICFGKYWIDKQPQRGLYIQWANTAFANSLQNFLDAGTITKIGNIYENADLCQALAVQSLNCESLKYPICYELKGRDSNG